MQVLKGHKKTVFSVAFSPEGRRLASCGHDRTVRLWDLDAGKQEQSLPGGEFLGGVAFSPDGKLLAWCGWGVRVWDISAGCKPLLQADDHRRQITFSRDGTCLVALGYEMTRWDTRTWKRLPGWDGAHASTDGESFATGSLALSHDGRLLATAHNALAPNGRRYDPVIRLWDAGTGEFRGEMGCVDQTTRALAFAPGDAVLAALNASTLRLWDVGARRELVRLKTGTKHLTGLAFSPDGRFLATVSTDESVRLWDAGTWAERTAFAWKVGKLQTVAFAPDGMRAAAAGSGGKVVVWDVDL